MVIISQPMDDSQKVRIEKLLHSKVIPVSGAIYYPIPSTVIDECLAILQKNNLYYRDYERHGYKYEYELCQAVTDEELIQHLDSYQDNGHYSFYKKFVLEPNKLRYALVVLLIAEDPYD